ncbi:MAG: branched chain amino acid aminotransferase, partial [Chloroflexi bacterium]
QEAFLTSSSRAIIPIVEIDGVTIGEGRRGAITQQLQQAYHEWVQAHLEAL